MTTVAENIQHLQSQIADSCAESSRDPASVTLLAVSKKKSASLILEAIEAGLQHFGENRVEEAIDKIPDVHQLTDKALYWHFVGHIQSRKARHITPQFHLIHSVDSLKLAEKLSRNMEDGGSKRLNVLLQMNVSGEEAKGGFEARHWQQDAAVKDELVETVGRIVELPGLTVRGLMTMAPIVEDMEDTRPIFSGLHELRDMLQAQLAVDLPELSMGMTDDFPIAIEEGATIIRVGRAIFGERN